MRTERNNAEFVRLSRECQRHLRSGQLDWYSFDLKSMAKLLDTELKYVDEAKVLMISFYVDLSGVGNPPFIDRDAVIALKEAIRKSGMDEYGVRSLYLEAVRSDTTPRHIMCVTDALYIMELMLAGDLDEAQDVLNRFILANGIQ